MGTGALWIRTHDSRTLGTRSDSPAVNRVVCNRMGHHRWLRHLPALCVACARGVPRTPAPLPPTPVVATATSANPPVVVATSSHTRPAPTPTQTPTRTPRSTRTRVPDTPTPQPTFNAGQRKDDVLQALNDPGCVLPCLLGITPGQTTSAQASNLLSALGIPSYRYQRDDGRIVYESGFHFWDDDVRQHLNLFDWNGQVDALHADAEGALNETAIRGVWARFAPEQLAAALGAPSRVLITFTLLGRLHGNAGREPYKIWMVHDHLHFAAAYSGLAVDRLDGYEVCPVYREGGNLSYSFDLYVNHAAAQQSLEDLIGISLEMPTPAQPIQEVANMQPAVFAGLLISTDRAPCFVAKPDA